MIPEGWREATAEELCSRISVGIVIKPTQYYVDEEQGVRAFRSANIGEGFVRDSDWIHISKDGHAKNKKSALKANDILIVRTGYPGTACLLPPEYEGSNCIDIIFARPDPRQVVPAYLCTFTNSEYGKKQVLDGSGGLAQQHFNVGAYKKLKLPLPPLFEQKRIAETLETWDRAIETVEALIANARAQKQALMQQLLPQGTTPPKKRLPGFSGEWREAEFNEVFDLKIGGTPARKNPAYWDGDKATQNRWVAISDLQGKYIDETQEHISDEGVQNSNVKALAAGTVIFSFKLSIGRKAILRKSAYTNEAICALIPKRREELSSLFVFHSLELVDFTASTDQAVKGATLNKAKIADLYLSFPSRTEQDRLVEVLEDADSEIANLQAQLTALRQEKAALMQQLLTGKRRVKLPESEVA